MTSTIPSHTRVRALVIILQVLVLFAAAEGGEPASYGLSENEKSDYNRVIHDIKSTPHSIQSGVSMYTTGIKHCNKPSYNYGVKAIKRKLSLINSDISLVNRKYIQPYLLKIEDLKRRLKLTELRSEIDEKPLNKTSKDNLSKELSRLEHNIGIWLELKRSSYIARKELRRMIRNIPPYPDPCEREAAQPQVTSEPQPETLPKKPKRPESKKAQKEIKKESVKPTLELKEYEEEVEPKAPKVKKKEGVTKRVLETELQRTQREWNEKIPKIPEDCCDESKLDVLKRKVSDLKKRCIKIADEAKTQQKYIRYELEEAKDTAEFKTDSWKAQQPYLERIRMWRRIQEQADRRFDELNQCLTAHLDTKQCSDEGREIAFRITRTVDFKITVKDLAGTGKGVWHESGRLQIVVTVRRDSGSRLVGEGQYEYSSKEHWDSWPTEIQQREGSDKFHVSGSISENHIKILTPREFAATMLYIGRLYSGPTKKGAYKHKIPVEEWCNFDATLVKGRYVPNPRNIVSSPYEGWRVESHIVTKILPINPAEGG